MEESKVTQVNTKINELLRWMPNGDQGTNNLLSYQQFLDSPIRQDGALPGSVADPATYNKVLHQLTKVSVGLALAMNYFGINVFDDMSPEEFRDAFIKSIGNAVVSMLSPDNKEGVKVLAGLTYTQVSTTLKINTPPDIPILTTPYDIGTNHLLIFLDGVFIPKGISTDKPNTKCWYEMGNPGTASKFVRFRFTASTNQVVTSLRLGDIKFSVND